MASLSLYPQFETNLMSNRKVVELLLQLRTTVPFVTAHLEIFHCMHHPVILCPICILLSVLP